MSQFASGLENADMPGYIVIIATEAVLAVASTFSVIWDVKKRAHHHAGSKMSCEVYPGTSTGFMGRDPDRIRLFSHKQVAARSSMRL